MPTKMNKAGEQQNYVPSGNGDASGEYTNEAGANKNFKTFKKQDESSQSFNAVNKMRTGKVAMPKEQKQEASKPLPQTVEEWDNQLREKKKDLPKYTEIKMSVKETPISKIDQETINQTLQIPQFDGLPDLPQVVDRAAKLIQKYEPYIDGVATNLESIASQNGGIMVGLEYRLKRLASLTRKIYAEISEKRAEGDKNFGYDDAFARMKDVGRFTMVFEEKDFVNGVNNALNELERQGFKVTKFKNTFKDNEPYKGINTNIVDKNGVIYEVQFHIPSSIRLKEGIEVDVKNKKAIADKDIPTSHEIYETTREIEREKNDGKVTPQRLKMKEDLENRSRSWWSKVPNINLERQLK